MPTFETTIHQGVIPTDIRRRIAAWIAQRREGSRVRVEVGPVKNTSPQQRYYFRTIVKTFQQCLLDDGEALNLEDVHDLMMREIGGFERVVEWPNGRQVKARRSLKDLSTVETEDYHERCRAHAAEWWGVVIPLPNEINTTTME